MNVNKEKRQKADEEIIKRAYEALEPQPGDPSFTGCQKCDAKCCNKSSPVLLPFEERLFLKLKLREKKKLDYRFQFFGRQPLGQPCVYLTKENKCEIYEDRPLDCRVYPALVEYRGQGMVMKRAPLCPFSNELSPSDFERARIAERAMWPLFTDEYKRMYTNAGEEFIVPKDAHELIQIE